MLFVFTNVTAPNANVFVPSNKSTVAVELFEAPGNACPSGKITSNTVKLPFNT